MPPVKENCNETPKICNFLFYFGVHIPIPFTPYTTCHFLKNNLENLDVNGLQYVTA